MKCARVRESLPGYLDGGLPEKRGRSLRVAIHEHLSGCEPCREELASYQRLQQLLGRTQAVAPPQNLGLEIRMALARAREVSDPRHWLRRFRDRAELWRANFLGPLTIPALGGLFAAFIIFAVVTPVYSRVAHLASMDDISDTLPIAILEPARVDSLSAFPVSGLDTSGPGVVMVQVTVGVAGDVVDYRIVAGPDDAGIRHQLDKKLLFSHFHPATSFGRPINGGQVLISFGFVTVNSKS
ncbi:MAG: zf-HC2 domain-containing protein [Candidatus Acidiferrales bacterium]